MNINVEKAQHKNMSQSLTKIYVHLIFSTKERFPFIITEWKNNLHAYIVGIIKKQTDSSFCAVGGTSNHIHVLFCLPKNKALSEVVQMIKGHSSLWMKQQGCQKFAWQGGYAAFSVSESVVKTTKEYIVNQEKHHKKMSFTEEVSKFCALYKIDKYDEVYFTKE